LTPRQQTGPSIACNRRDFLAAAALVTAPFANALRGAEPILDFHQHTRYSVASRRRSDQELIAHQLYIGVTTSVLLPGEGWMLSQLGDNASCAALEADYPGQFVRFACADPAESRSIDVLRGNLSRGAIGLGELKFPVAVDAPEMHRIYKLADELAIPVLLHFQFETYNTGIERFENILKAYPKVNFVGHAQTWWGNISADLNPLDLYPKGPVRPGGLTGRLLQDYPNIYGDLSANSGLNAITRDPEFARGFIQRHSRKLIWASDCNCIDGKGGGTSDGYCIGARSLAALRKLVPGEDVFRRITHENGASLLRRGH
jgi:predicted TIM-barrel fold metal-dependent hydrolase